MGLPFAALVKIDVSQSADFRDPFQLVRRADRGLLRMTCADPRTGRLVSLPAEPVDLSYSVLVVEISPSFGDPRVIATLSSNASDEIVILDKLNALASFAVPMETVEGWPLGSWSYVMRMVTGAEYCEVMRGPFNVHPRKFEASA